MNKEERDALDKAKKKRMDEVKQFIKDYYANMSYEDLFIRYGLNKEQADARWDNIMKHIDEGGKTHAGKEETS